MKAARRYYSPLARRIGIYVILVSACITLVTSGIQLYSEYNRDIGGIKSRLKQLETTQLSNIASRLWVLDISELKRTLNALLELQSIEYIEVYDYDKLLLSAGQDFSKNAIVVKHKLLYESNNETYEIGSVVIKASLDEVYSLIFSRAAIIILSNGVKTFIVAAFILFIFYHLVAKHLLAIARHTETKDFLNSDISLALDRRHNIDETDELDAVVSSINSLRHELQLKFREILNQRQYLSLTLNSIGDAVITTDINGYVSRMNSAAEKYTGWLAADAMKQSINRVFRIINSETSAPIDNIFPVLLNEKGGSNNRNNTVLFSKNGNEYHISYSATPIKDEDEKLLGFVLIFHDVTEQYILREDIAKRKRDMQAIMDNSPSVIYIKDISGKYIFINKRYEQLFKISRETIIGKTDYDIFPKEAADIFKRNDDNVKRAGHALEIEESAPHSNGEIHTYMSVKFPLFEDTGNIYAICGQSTDITERKIQEANLRRTQKMDALGKLTSGIAHDFNNMLGIILGYAQLLEASLEDKPKIKNYASEIRRAGDRGTKLTKKLLDFSSHNTSDAAELSINKLLKDEEQMLAKTLTARIRLEMFLEEDLWLTTIDAAEFEDAVVNMCINAMHAINDKGTITINTKNRILNARDAERLNVTPGEYVELSIADTGCGMDEHTKDRIFDPFYSTKGDKGTGLGLSQVYGFVERSFGAIEVLSSPGNGSMFNIYFPKSVVVANTEKIYNDTENVEILNGDETILVVDDEPSLLNLVNDSLTLHGYKVITASNGQDALEILMREPVDLVISDIIMPKLDGTQLAIEIQNRFPHVKMQMVSGYVDDKITHLIDKTLVKDILYKPFLMEDLITRVRTLLQNHSDSSSFTGCTVLVMDDLPDVRELFQLNLQKLGCEVLTVDNGEDAISIYKKYMEEGKKIDVVILDLTIPGGVGGKEVAKTIRSMDKHAKLIFASGYTENYLEATNDDNYVDATVDKSFNRDKLKQVLQSVLH